MQRISTITAEFILIVVGVLVALMIDNAVEERHDDELREAYLLRLQDDFAFDQQAIRRPNAARNGLFQYLGLIGAPMNIGGVLRLP